MDEFERSRIEDPYNLEYVIQKQWSLSVKRSGSGLISTSYFLQREGSLESRIVL